MKSLITRRIIYLLSFTVIISSVLISFLGIYLAEGILDDIQGQEFVPDLPILEKSTVAYLEGDIDKEVFRTILKEATKDQVKKYILYNQDGLIIYETGETVDGYIVEKVEGAVQKVLRTKEPYKDYSPFLSSPIEILGVPLIKDDKAIGVAFVLVDVMGIPAIKASFLRSLAISIIGVIIFALVVSNIVLRRIIKPVRGIVSVALSITEGDFSIKADESIKGELGLIGKTMNRLSVELYKNISQLYIEKNRLDQVLNSLEEGMIAVGKEYNITHYNQVLLNMFGLKKEEVQNQVIENYGILKECYEIVGLAYEDKGTKERQLTYNGKIYRLISEPITDEKDKVVGVVILFRDVTELEMLEMTRKNYVANVSHELRSPLTSIRGLIEPLMDSIVTNEEDVKKYYEIIYKESLRLSRLVDDIMELSRLQTNDALIQKSEVRLHGLLEMVYERYQVIDEDIELIYKPTELPFVYTNYDRVEQVLVILLDNAFKFTGEGGKVELVAEVDEETVIITVKDNGIGIEEKDLPYVFDRFYKSDQSRGKKGTGLGLSIAKEIMDIMGETIECHSRIGEGSQFSFTISRYRDVKEL